MNDQTERHEHELNKAGAKLKRGLTFFLMGFVCIFALNAQARLSHSDLTASRTTPPASQPGRTSLDFANVFGSNDKVFVEHVLHLNRPLSKIGKLFVPDGSCTASLVGPNLILTAAHCIANKSGTDLQQGSFVFALGYHQGTALAESPVEAVWYGSFDFDRGDRKSDWAVLKLRDDLGETYGYFGWINMDEYDPRAQSLTQAGYGKLWKDGSEITVHEGCGIRGSTNEQRLILHDCDTSVGDSGAPLLYCQEPSDCRIVAIHAAEQRAGAPHTLRLEAFDPKRPNLAVPASQFIPALWNLLKK